jgi:hypothetical protein
VHTLPQNGIRSSLFSMFIEIVPLFLQNLPLAGYRSFNVGAGHVTTWRRHRRGEQTRLT